MREQTLSKVELVSRRECIASNPFLAAACDGARPDPVPHRGR